MQIVFNQIFTDHSLQNVWGSLCQVRNYRLISLLCVSRANKCVSLKSIPQRLLQLFVDVVYTGFSLVPHHSQAGITGA